MTESVIRALKYDGTSWRNHFTIPADTQGHKFDADMPQISGSPIAEVNVAATFAINTDATYADPDARSSPAKTFPAGTQFLFSFDENGLTYPPEPMRGNMNPLQEKEGHPLSEIDQARRLAFRSGKLVGFDGKLRLYYSPKQPPPSETYMFSEYDTNLSNEAGEVLFRAPVALVGDITREYTREQATQQPFRGKLHIIKASPAKGSLGNETFGDWVLQQDKITATRMSTVENRAHVALNEGAVATAVYQGLMYIAYYTEKNVVLRAFDGIHWGLPIEIALGGDVPASFTHPALAVFQGLLHVLYCKPRPEIPGSPRLGTLCFRTFNGARLSPESTIPTKIFPLGTVSAATHSNTVYKTVPGQTKKTIPTGTTTQLFCLYQTST